MGNAMCGEELVEYYLLVEEMDGLLERYGVQVAGFGRTAEIRGITVCQERVLELARTLIRGTVTPLAVQDVVEDFLLD